MSLVTEKVFGRYPPRGLRVPARVPQPSERKIWWGLDEGAVGDRWRQCGSARTAVSGKALRHIFPAHTRLSRRAFDGVARMGSGWHARRNARVARCPRISSQATPLRLKKFVQQARGPTRAWDQPRSGETLRRARRCQSIKFFRWCPGKGPRAGFQPVNQFPCAGGKRRHAVRQPRLRVSFSICATMEGRRAAAVAGLVLDAIPRNYGLWLAGDDQSSGRPCRAGGTSREIGGAWGRVLSTSQTGVPVELITSATACGRTPGRASGSGWS